MEFGFRFAHRGNGVWPALSEAEHGIEPCSTSELPGAIVGSRSFRGECENPKCQRQADRGLVFNAALADATEHWKWLHWDFDPGRPIREFGWNKLIRPGEKKKLSWYYADLDLGRGQRQRFLQIRLVKQP